uniref:S1 family peptidase n=1 Tax=Parabacteroides distasonis TaxID=823 RepID=UPI004026AA6B
MKTKIFSFLISFFVCASLYAQQRIIGGTAIDISQRPFQAAIFISGTFNGGGVIINNQWILTAAHVISAGSTSTITVSSGYTNLTNNPSRSSVSQIIKHSSADIALLKLSSPLTFGSTRKPVNISNSTTYSSGTTATVSGWGRRVVGGESSLTQLYKTSVTIESCNSNYITAKKSNTSSYKGDSGGPLTISTSNGDLLIGIVEGGNTDNPSANPTTYINIGTYRNWIASYVDLYSVSGPDLICAGSTGTFTISAPGATLELSPNLSIVSQSGKNYTIKANNTGRAYVNILAGNTNLARKPLWVGAPIISGITLNGYTLTAETFGGDASISRTEWNIGGNIFTSPSKSISSPYSSGTYTVSVRGSNSCGTGAYYTTQISFSNSRAYSVSVASGSKLVTVAPIPQENDEMATATASSNQSSETLRYVLADLMSGQAAANGILPASGGTLDFSNAPSGLYALKLYTANGTEETFKISLK